VATWDDVRRVALALPEVAELPSYGGLPRWSVRGRSLVWDRPVRGKDRVELGADVPDGPVLGAWVGDEGEKQALLASDPEVFFTISHLDGYPAVLVRLDLVDVQQLRELVTDAWRLRAPKRLLQQHPELTG
jgi:hypothetical protein